MTLDALTTHLASIAEHLGAIDGRLGEMGGRLDAVHALARQTNGRVNAHDVAIAEIRAAALARADERERVEEEHAEAADRRRERLARVAGWVLPSLVGGVISLVLAHAVG